MSVVYGTSLQKSKGFILGIPKWVFIFKKKNIYFENRTLSILSETLAIDLLHKMKQWCVWQRFSNLSNWTFKKYNCPFSITVLFKNCWPHIFTITVSKMFFFFFFSELCYSEGLLHMYRCFFSVVNFFLYFVACQCWTEDIFLMKTDMFQCLFYFVKPIS